MFVSLRGPGGSGKSYVGHALLDAYPHVPIFDDTWNKQKPKLIGYELPGGLVVLGRYTAPGGGLDGFLTSKTRDKFHALIRKYATTKPFVFGESLTISSSRIWWEELADELGYGALVFAFLNTPPDLCVQRILHRNGGKPIHEDQVHAHYRFIQRLAGKFEMRGDRVVHIDYKQSVEAVTKLFTEAGWRP